MALLLLAVQFVASAISLALLFLSIGEPTPWSTLPLATAAGVLLSAPVAAAAAFTFVVRISRSWWAMPAVTIAGSLLGLLARGPVSGGRAWLVAQGVVYMLCIMAGAALFQVLSRSPGTRMGRLLVLAATLLGTLVLAISVRVLAGVTLNLVIVPGASGLLEGVLRQLAALASVPDAARLLTTWAAWFAFSLGVSYLAHGDIAPFLNGTAAGSAADDAPPGPA